MIPNFFNFFIDSYALINACSLTFSFFVNDVGKYLTGNFIYYTFTLFFPCMGNPTQRHKKIEMVFTKYL